MLPRIPVLKAEHPFWGYRRVWAYLQDVGEGVGWVYIVMVRDWYTKMVVGRYAGLRGTGQHWQEVLDRAVNRPVPYGVRGQDVSLMSDNGCQPTSTAFMQACATLELHQAFTRDHNPEGNADTGRFMRPLADATGASARLATHAWRVSVVFILPGVLLMSSSPRRTTYFVGAHTLENVRAPLRIGGNATYGEHLHGVTDEERIYGRAQTPDEIRRDMSTSAWATPPRADLVAAYECDEGAGTMVRDMDGSGKVRPSPHVRRTQKPGVDPVARAGSFCGDDLSGLDIPNARDHRVEVGHQ